MKIKKYISIVVLIIIIFQLNSVFFVNVNAAFDSMRGEVGTRPVTTGSDAPQSDVPSGTGPTTQTNTKKKIPYFTTISGNAYEEIYAEESIVDVDNSQKAISNIKVELLNASGNVVDTIYTRFKWWIFFFSASRQL